MQAFFDAVKSGEHELRLAASGRDGRVYMELSAVNDELLRSDFALPFTFAEVEAGVATAKGLTEQYVSRSQHELPPDPLRELGRLLFDAVFAGRGKALLDRCRDRARDDGSGLRLRVVFPREAGGQDVRWLPWEFLYDSRRRDFLALSVLSQLVRDTDRPPPDQIGLVCPPVRVLVVGADFTGTLGVADEVQKLRAIAARNRQQLRLSVLLDATGPELLEAVREREYHVLHFIGHGLPADATGEACDALVLMPEDREPAADGTFHTDQVVKAESLCDAVGDNGGVRLVILDACNTDEIAAGLAGAAGRPDQKTVQGAVGVRGSISTPACAAFATELYRAIVRGAPLDTAVTFARRQVDQRLTGSREWGLQTFYLQTPDGEFALWPVQRLLGTGEWASDRTGGRVQRKAALLRVIYELNRRALEDQIERCDGRAPQVVHDQLKVVKARLKSL